MKRIAFLVALCAVGLLAFFSDIGTNEMPKLQVELIVDEPLRTTGGTVFISIKHLPRDQFDQRFVPSDEAGSLIQRVRVSAMVTFVEIETPESDYVYRFVNDPEGPDAAKAVDQAEIGVAGAGALYIDLASNQPVYSDGGRDHHIFGATLRKDDSIGMQNNSLDLRVDAATCTQSGPVRLCPARQAEVDRLLEIVRMEEEE